MIITCVSHQWMIAPILHQNRLNQWQTTSELAACPQKVASIWPHWNCAAGFTSPEIWKSFADRCPKIYKISPGKLWHVINHQCGCSHCSHPFNESCATCTAEKLRIMRPWHHNEKPSLAWLKENLIGQPWIYHAFFSAFYPPLTNSGKNMKNQGWLGPLLPGIPRLVSMKASGISDFAALFDSGIHHGPRSAWHLRTTNHHPMGPQSTPIPAVARFDGFFFSLQAGQIHKRRAFRFPPFVDFLEVFGASDFAAAAVEFSFGFGCLGFSAVALPAMRRLAFLRSLVLEKLPKVVFMDLSYSVAIFFSSCRF